MKAKVCLVGANRGCKTGLVRSHVRDEFDDRYIATLGAKVSHKRLRVKDAPGYPSVSLDLLLWDILSHRAYRELLKEAYFHGASGILAVADMTRRRTLQEAGDWIQDVEQVVGQVPVVVIGANRDAAERREVSEDDVRRLAESYGAACFFASANSGDSVEDAFAILAERITSQRFRTTAGPHPPTSPTT